MGIKFDPAELMARLNELETMRDQYNREISSKKTARSQIETMLGTTKTKITEQENKLKEYTNLKTSLETIKADYSALETSMGSVVTELNNLADGNSIGIITHNLGNNMTTAAKKIGDITSINGAIDEKITKIQTELTRLNAQKTTFEKDIAMNNQAIANYEALVSNINAEINSILEEL